VDDAIGVRLTALSMMTEKVRQALPEAQSDQCDA
jgi:hypothetical protein